MTPYYDDGRAVIYHADCRELLPTFGDDDFDVAFADPPYGVGLKYGDDYSDSVGYADVAGDLCRVASVALVTPGIRDLTAWPRPTWAICWAKPGSTRRSDLGGFNEWEPVLMYGKRRLYHDLRILPTITNVANGGTGDHPCPKPLALLRWLLAECSTGGAVLDPFVGSGTTLRAAKDLGLRSVGIDTNESYCELAARRLDQQVFDFAESDIS